MSGLEFAWKNLMYSRRCTIAVLLLSLCAMVLMVVGTFLGQGLKKGLTSAVEPFDLLVGYGGSYQMVLNTVFLQDYPAGNIPYHVVETLREDLRVASVIPLAFGDNHRGYRIAGVSNEIFSHTIGGADVPWLTFAEGDSFRSGTHGAVAGSAVARELGLRIGDPLATAHGFISAGSEQGGHEPYVLTGILESCRGPYDRAIFVDIQTIWDAHGHGGDEERDMPESAVAADSRKVTAIMVKPAGYAEAYAVYADFANTSEADMVFPAQVVVRLLSVLGQADWLFRAIGAVAGVMAACMIALTLYWSTSSRKRETGILRLLGAERRQIASIMYWEGILSVMPGVVGGCLLGHIFLGSISSVLAGRTSLHIEAGLSWVDVVLGLFLLMFGLAGTTCAMVRAGKVRVG